MHERLFYPADSDLIEDTARGRRRYVIAINGVGATPREWAEAAGIPYSTLMDRLHHGHTGTDLIRPALGPGRWPRMLTHEGCTMRLDKWARLLGITPSTLKDRLRRGWSVARAVTTPGDPVARKNGKRRLKATRFAASTQAPQAPNAPFAPPKNRNPKSGGSRGQR